MNRLARELARSGVKGAHHGSIQPKEPSLLGAAATLDDLALSVSRLSTAPPALKKLQREGVCGGKKLSGNVVNTVILECGK